MAKMKDLTIEAEENEDYGSPFHPNNWQGGREVAVTLNERGRNYGQYHNVAFVAQKLKNVVRSGAAWDSMEPYMQESLDMICNKMARICNGNPYYDDSWHDIGGYSKLVEDELEKMK